MNAIDNTTGSNNLKNDSLGVQRTKHPLQLGVFDIDGTLRTARDPWIHLNEHLGYSEQAQMHKSLFFDGKIDYQGWVDRDAALWKGIHRGRILQALDTNPLKPGAAELLNWFKANNIPIIGISTGLDVFNNIIAQQFSFKFIRSNELLFDEHDVCLGIAKIHVREDGKGEILNCVLAELGITADAVAVFGDGSADIGMFKIAGLSVAVSPSKETIRSTATYSIDEEPLDSALRYLRNHFITGAEEGCCGTPKI